MAYTAKAFIGLTGQEITDLILDWNEVAPAAESIHLSVVAQLAVDVHIGLVVMSQPQRVETTLVDALQRRQRLSIESHRRALKGLQRIAVGSLVRASLPDGHLTGTLEEDQRRVVAESTIAAVELHRQLILPLWVGSLLIIAVQTGRQLLILRHILRRMLDSVIYLPVELLHVLALSKEMADEQQRCYQKCPHSITSGRLAQP